MKLRVVDVTVVPVVLAIALASAARADAFPLPVLVGKADNLQYVSFYVADGAGYFADESIAVSIVTSGAPADVEEDVKSGRAQAFVLSPPSYLRLIDDNAPIVIVANLLSGEAANLVVRPEEVKKRGLDVKQPLKEKLAKLQGLKVGIAPGPVTRLRTMFSSVGLDAKKDIDMVTVPGPKQNDAYGDGSVDALFCHTPFLEKALVDQGAVLIVRTSAGEVPELTHMQVHVLAFTKSFVDAHDDVVTGAVAAIARAQRLIHKDPRAAVDALQKVIPERPRAHLEKLIEIYAPAVPDDPAVDPAKVAQREELFPAHQGAPALAHVDVASFFDRRFADRAQNRFASLRSAMPRRHDQRVLPLVVAGVALALIIVGIVLRSRRRSDESSTERST